MRGSLAAASDTAAISKDSLELRSQGDAIAQLATESIEFIRLLHHQRLPRSGLRTRPLSEDLRASALLRLRSVLLGLLRGLALFRRHRGLLPDFLFRVAFFGHTFYFLSFALLCCDDLYINR
jgi:hypothetical protein